MLNNHKPGCRLPSATLAAGVY